MKPHFTKSPDGLIPVIIQDSITNIVLMLGYMNQEAFDKTQQEKRVTFFSRSKNRLWTKGEESGNFLNVNSLLLDCDNDTILIKTSVCACMTSWSCWCCFYENGIIIAINQH